MNQYLTLPQAAKACPVKEYMLRRMCKAGVLPGFYAGRVFYVNTTVFLENLEQFCQEYKNRCETV